MSELEKIKKKRAVIRTNQTKLLSKIDAGLIDKAINIIDCETLLKQLCLNDDLLKELDDSIYNLLSVDEIESETNTSEDYKEKSLCRKIKLEHKINDLKVPLSLNAAASNVVPLVEKPNVESKSVKLPKLTVTKFYGDPSRYLEFWNQFENAIHKNESLSAIDKFCYLRSLTAGIAADCIRGFTMTPENYEEAINLLNKTFGQKDMLINAHMTNLLNVKPLKDSKNLEGLRRLYYTLQNQIRSLSSLGVKSESYGNLLCPILLKLIPPELTLDYSKTQKGTLNQNVDDLMEFLFQEICNREKAHLINPEIRTESKFIHNNKQFNFRFRKPLERKTYSPPPPKQAPRDSSVREFMTTASEPDFNCIFCDSSDHNSGDCETVNVRQKREKLKIEGRCYLCLNKSHVMKSCPINLKCSHCGMKHNKTLCFKRERSISADLPQNKTEIKDTKPTNIASNYVGNNKNGILLQTVKTEIVGSCQNETVFCLFDNGSERTFIRKDVSRKLKLKSLGKEQLFIYTFQSEIPKKEICRKVLVTLRGVNNGCEIDIEALEIENISNAIITLPGENIRFDMQSKGIILTHSVDDLSNKNRISLLIGTDNYWNLVTGRIERLDQHLVALETEIGWSIQGRVSEGCNTTVSMNFVLDEKDTCFDLKRFWELENLGIENSKTNSSDTEDNEILNSFNDSIRFIDGRYKVKLPWKDNLKDKLDNNKKIASERFRNLTRRFRANPTLFDEYSKVINDYMREGIIEHASSDSDKQTFFLPHREVIRNDKSTSKLRIVFDGSSHDKNKLSLNDCLHIGPNLYPNLLELLLKFRQNAVAITADIKQAFLQILLDDIDKDFTCFYWTDNLNATEPAILNFDRVLFGLRSSPFLLAATLKFHIKKYKDVHPETYSILNESLYVDDLITGDDEVTKALSISLESLNILKDAGMFLRKWQTNSKELIKLWKDLGIEVEESQNIISPNNTPSKVLGIAWNSKTDEIYFDVSKLVEFLSNRIDTKRFILQVVGRIFDPIGFLSPFVIRVKCLLQEIWRTGADWDTELPIYLIDVWKKWCSEVNDLGKLRVPRYYLEAVKYNEIAYFEIHCFSDASKIAYGAVIYLRTVTKNGEIYVCFISSKTRVAPLKTLTLPRLELMGALLSARLAKQVADCLKFEANKFFWTDSSITLHWIKGNKEKFKLFVKNRVEEIQNLSDTDRWFHCPGKLNPADILSRGSTVEKLMNSTWFYGPEFLLQSKDNWPNEEECLVDEKDLEIRKCVLVNKCILQKVELLDMEKYSRLIKVVRIFAFIKRFIAKVRKQSSESGCLTANEIESAKNDLIRNVQTNNYYLEIQNLKNNRAIPRNSNIFSLAPYLDKDNILRVKGRIQESDYIYDEKHPIIIPRNSKFTELLIKEKHENVLHSGISATLTEIRKKYWVPKGRQLVKKVIKNCLICKKYFAKPANQLTAQLPKDRMAETPPFTICGIDFAGPIFVKNDKTTSKAYVTLFTCGVTRAIHLELVSNLSTENFLLAFKRFQSRRGVPKIIYSDNAKTFKRANNELQKIYRVLKDTKFQDFVAVQNITWKFIVERAPWWGGFYERLVRSVKDPIRKILGKALLTFEELTTILSEIEAIINERPLSFVSDVFGEPSPLTPNHFLRFGKEDLELPISLLELELESKNSFKNSLAKRKIYQVRLLKQLWVRWKNQYLLNLRNANHLKTPQVHENLKVGDVVLLEGSEKSKMLWDLAVIKEIIKGRDGNVRAAIIKTAKANNLRRPIQLLYPLELNSDST